MIVTVTDQWDRKTTIELQKNMVIHVKVQYLNSLKDDEEMNLYMDTEEAIDIAKAIISLTTNDEQCPDCGHTFSPMTLNSSPFACDCGFKLNF